MLTQTSEQFAQTIIKFTEQPGTTLEFFCSEQYAPEMRAAMQIAEEFLQARYATYTIVVSKVLNSTDSTLARQVYLRAWPAGTYLPNQPYGKL